MDVTKQPGTLKLITFTSLISTLFVLFLVIAALSCIPVPDKLQYQQYMGQLAISDPKKLDGDFIQLFTIGKMVKDGTLISLKDFLGYQADFYQVIITLLIALNAIIAGVCFFFIKGRSEEKAEIAAIKHLNTERFEETLRRNINRTVRNTLDDVTMDQISDILDSNKSLEEELLAQKANNESLQRQIEAISARLAELDTDETEGSDLKIEG